MHKLRMLYDERSQASVEYILILGGIILGALIIAIGYYKRIVSSGGNKLEVATGEAGNRIVITINNTINNMS